MKAYKVDDYPMNYHTYEGLYLQRNFLKSIDMMLNTNPKYRLVSNKYKSVDRFLNYFKQCSFIKFKSIKESREIKRYFKNHKKYLSNYKQILKNLLNGKGVESHLSKRTHNFHPDSMYMDWGLIHLHFDTNVRSKHRSNETLLIRILGLTVYVITVIPHGSNVYTNKKYLQIIYNNWLNTLTKTKMTPDESSLKMQTNQGIKKLRRIGGNQIYTINDNDGNPINIFPPGGFTNMAKSLNLSDNVDQLQYLLFNIFTFGHIHSKYILQGHFFYDYKNSIFKFIDNNKSNLELCFSDKFILNSLLNNQYLSHLKYILIFANSNYEQEPFKSKKMFDVRYNKQGPIFHFINIE